MPITLTWEEAEAAGHAICVACHARLTASDAKAASDARADLVARVAEIRGRLPLEVPDNDRPPDRPGRVGCGISFNRTPR